LAGYGTAERAAEKLGAEHCAAGQSRFGKENKGLIGTTEVVP